MNHNQTITFCKILVYQSGRQNKRIYASITNFTFLKELIFTKYDLCKQRKRIHASAYIRFQF